MSAEDDEVIRRERENHMTMLRSIPRRRAELDEMERSIVRYARLIGISWDDIAEAIGHEDNITVQEKYGEPGPDEDPF